MVECRDGFLFTIRNAQAWQVGSVNGFRFPQFLELNLGLKRHFHFHGSRWAGRFGSSNITDHNNPNTVNNNTGAAHFLKYYGGQRRTFEFRLRWLGTAEKHS